MQFSPPQNIEQSRDCFPFHVWESSIPIKAKKTGVIAGGGPSTSSERTDDAPAYHHTTYRVHGTAHNYYLHLFPTIRGILCSKNASSLLSLYDKHSAL